MNKFVAIFVAIQICFLPVMAYADPVSGTPMITPLKKGSKAPYSGSLLNNAALAKIKTEKEAAKERCELENKYLKMRGKTECDLKVQNAKIELDVSQKKFGTIIKIKDDEIERLQDIAIKSSKGSSHKWWLAGGIVVGVAITVGAFLLAAQVQKVQ